MPNKTFPVTIRLNFTEEHPRDDYTHRIHCFNCLSTQFSRAIIIGEHLFIICSKCNSVSEVYHVIVEHPELKSP